MNDEPLSAANVRPSTASDGKISAAQTSSARGVGVTEGVCVAVGVGVGLGVKVGVNVGGNVGIPSAMGSMLGCGV